jgi:hypothetical protein
MLTGSFWKRSLHLLAAKRKIEGKSMAGDTVTTTLAVDDSPFQNVVRRVKAAMQGLAGIGGGVKALLSTIGAYCMGVPMLHRRPIELLVEEFKETSGTIYD